MTTETDAAATRIVHALTGGRWTWPPVRVRELYPAPTGKIRLQGRPVTNVVSVKRCSDQSDLEHTLFRNGLIELSASSRSWCSSADARVDIVYEYGAEPSAMIRNAIAALSTELNLANTDPGACRLPEQVTSVNRQGVSWSIIDPNSFLDRGRTGIYEIDLAIVSAGTPKARSKVFSKSFPPPVRVETTVLQVP